MSEQKEAKNRRNAPKRMISKSQYIQIEAAVVRQKGEGMKLESLVMEPPREDEILVHLVATGICHTDIDMMDEWDAATGPVVLGHEGAGIVERVGTSVQKIQPGDHVVLSYQSCGTCAECLRGHPYRCLNFYELNFGFHRLDGSNALRQSGVRGHFFGQSSFASDLLATERNVVKVPKDLSLHVLAPLGCGIQTGAGTVMNSLNVTRGKSIAIFGTGAVGIAAAMAARIVGANPIIGVDVKPKRLDLALKLGVTDTIINRRTNVLARVTEITGRGVDYVVDTTGDIEMQAKATSVLNPNGIVALLTGEPGSDNFPGGRRTMGIIQGNAVSQEFIPKLIDLYRSGAFPFDLLEKNYAFHEINQAIADAKRGITIKPVLDFGVESI